MEQSRPKQRTRIILLVAIIAATVVAIAASAFVLMNPQGTNSTRTTETFGSIAITEQGVVPPIVTIKKGSNVTWTNADSAPHALSLSTPNPPQELAGFGSDEPLAKGESYSFTFDATGTFTYQDPTQPEKVQGTIVVE